MKRIWRMAGVGVLVVSVGAQVMADERDNAPREGQVPPGRVVSMNGALKVAGGRRTIHRVLRTISHARRISHVHRINLSSVAARTATLNGKLTLKAMNSRARHPSHNPRTPCRSRAARIRCARPRNRARVTTATSRAATTATRSGKPVVLVRVPAPTRARMTTVGQVVPTAMAMAGAQARSIAPAMLSTAFPTAITVCRIAARTISSQVATGTVHRGRVMSSWRRRMASVCITCRTMRAKYG